MRQILEDGLKYFPIWSTTYARKHFRLVDVWKNWRPTVPCWNLQRSAVTINWVYLNRLIMSLPSSLATWRKCIYQIYLPMIQATFGRHLRVEVRWWKNLRSITSNWPKLHWVTCAQTGSASKFLHWAVVLMQKICGKFWTDQKFSHHWLFRQLLSVNLILKRLRTECMFIRTLLKCGKSGITSTYPFYWDREFFLIISAIFVLRRSAWKPKFVVLWSIEIARIF